MEFIQKYAKIDGDDDLDDQMSDAGGDEVNYCCKIYWRWQTKCSGSEFIRLSSDECHQEFAEGFTQPLNVCRAGQVFWPWKFCAWLCRQSRVWIWQIQRLSKKTEKSAKDLKTFEENSKDSFYNTILFGAFHALLDNKENSEFDQSRLVEVFGQNFFDELQEKKEMLELDLNSSNFQMRCHVINDILMNKRLFYEFTTSEKSFVISLRKCLRKRTMYEEIFWPVPRSNLTFQYFLKNCWKQTKRELCCSWRCL